MFRAWMIATLLLGWSQTAGACQYTARSLEDTLNAAPTAFVGTVTTVENGLVIFRVEKPLKGIVPLKQGEEGIQTFEADLHARSAGSCGIDFSAGQRWLYLGNDAPSGSLQLQDDMGRPNKENLEYIKAKVGDVGQYGSEVVGGTMAAACSRRGGDAFGITLDNGVSVSVEASLSDLDKKDMNAVASYTANGAESAASILQCPRMKDGQPENRPCRSMKGTVSLGFVTADGATGQVKTEDGEYHSLYVFHVKRDKTPAVCGGK